jgi:hypothetical protein
MDNGYRLDMQCRAPGCKEISRGPRYYFHCRAHQKYSVEARKRNMARYAAAKKAEKKKAKSKEVKHTEQQDRRRVAPAKPKTPARGNVVKTTHVRQAEVVPPKHHILVFVIPLS